MAPYDLNANASSGSPDMAVDIPQNEPIKPAAGAPAAWLAKPRNKWLAAGGLLALIAIPAIVVPVVLTQQNNDNASSAATTSLQDTGSPLPSSQTSGSATNGADDDTALGVSVGENLGSGAGNATGALLNPLLERNTTLNSTLNSTLLNSTVPLNATWEDEVVLPYVRVQDGVVRNEACRRHRLYVHCMWHMSCRMHA
jgi:hypothetical protein